MSYAFHCRFPLSLKSDHGMHDVRCHRSRVSCGSTLHCSGSHLRSTSPGDRAAEKAYTPAGREAFQAVRAHPKKARQAMADLALELIGASLRHGQRRRPSHAVARNVSRFRLSAKRWGARTAASVPLAFSGGGPQSQPPTGVSLRLAHLRRVCGAVLPTIAECSYCQRGKHALQPTNPVQQPNMAESSNPPLHALFSPTLRIVRRAGDASCLCGLEIAIDGRLPRGCELPRGVRRRMA